MSKSSNPFLPFCLLFAAVAFGSVAARGGVWNDGQNASSVLGQAGFTQGTAQAGAAGMFQPSSVTFDPTSGKLFVADCANNRILRFTNAQALITGGLAEAAFGQTDLNGATGGFTGSKIRCSGELAIDPLGHLWVADIDNNRVLRWDNAATVASGQAAAAVLGQPDLTTVTAGTARNAMSGPEGIFIDQDGRLWVADTGNNRVLRFDDAANTAAGANADAVLGQVDFVSSTAAMSQTGFSAPNSITGNSTGTIWVSDSANNRVLRFDSAASKVNGDNADSVIGSANYISISFSGITASSLDTPTGLAIDPEGRLYVADGNNDRVLIFNGASSLGAGAAASNVLGQSTYADPTARLTQSGLDMPYAPVWDETSQSLWVADLGNNRVLRFFAADPTPTPTPTPEPTPTPDIQISGTINFGVQPSKQVPGVTMTATGTPGATALSDLLGNYTLTGLGSGPYTVTPSKTGDVNGITGFDASLVLHEFAVGGGTLTANQKIAADTNNNGTVTGFDASQILAYFANAGPTGSTGQTGTWRFSPASRTYASLSGVLASQNFDGILVGDVNGNWNQPTSFADKADDGTNFQNSLQSTTVLPSSLNAPTAGPITISLPAASGSRGTTITVPVSMTNASGSINDYRFTVLFNPAVLQAASPAFSTTSPTATLTPATFAVNSTVDNVNGKLGIGAAGNLSEFITASSGTLIYLRFTVQNSGPTSTTLTFQTGNAPDGNPQTFFEDDSGNPITASGTPGSFTVLGSTAAGVTISGRVLASNGAGLRNARVVLTDMHGQIHTATTTAFGYYVFSDVPAGAAYVLDVQSRSFTYRPRVITVLDSVANLDFTPE